MLLDTMVGIPSRHKSLVLLVGVIVLQVLFLAVTPFERAGATTIGGIRGAWNHYLALQKT